MRALGIDVGVRKGLDLLLLDGRRAVRRAHSAVTLSGLAGHVEAWRPDVIAVDSPPAFGITGRSRGAERDLRERGIHSFAVPSGRTERRNPFYDWMRRGHETFHIAEACGYPLFRGERSVRHRAIEVFPHASAVALKGSLPPLSWSRNVRRKREWRRAILVERGVDAAGLATIDQIDAALAALTGLLALERRFVPVGDPAEGLIVLPGDSLPARFRREPEGGDPGDGHLPGLRPCGCGCGSPVRGRFAPGHDATLKYRLWDDVRRGEAARRELGRLGWRMPPEVTR